VEDAVGVEDAEPESDNDPEEVGERELVELAVVEPDCEDVPENNGEAGGLPDAPGLV